MDLTSILMNLGMIFPQRWGLLAWTSWLRWLTAWFSRHPNLEEKAVSSHALSTLDCVFQMPFVIAVPQEDSSSRRKGLSCSNLTSYLYSLGPRLGEVMLRGDCAFVFRKAVDIGGTAPGAVLSGASIGGGGKSGGRCGHSGHAGGKI